jgi:3alpha(or 20beta)-hydroxysteroid dehydrogenase
MVQERKGDGKMTLLAGKTAIITGAGSRGGQGEAEARLLVEHGARVVIADLPSSQGKAIAAEIDSDRAVFRELDVTDDKAWQQVVTEMAADYNGIDILVNNAGLWLQKGVLETSPEEFRRVVEINQTGVFLGMNAVGAIMKERGGGSIINTCSTSGLRGGGMPHAYAASKWAVRGMSRAAAHELAPFNIRVNAICPGVIDTPMIEGGAETLKFLSTMIPSGKIGRPQDVAQLVLFLASDASSYISGAEIAIDSAATA